MFAPLAAAVHDRGPGSIEYLQCGQDLERITFPVPRRKGDDLHGEVLVVDAFGNVITNITAGELGLPPGSAIAVNEDMVAFVRSYAYVEDGERLGTIGSHGNLELAVNCGRGDDAFELLAGDQIVVSVDEN